MEHLSSAQRVTLKNDALLNFAVNQEKLLDTVFQNLADFVRCQNKCASL